MRTIRGLRGMCVVLAAAAAGCSGGESGDKAGAPGSAAAGAAAAAAAPLRVVLGDCASPTTAFLSGPRPMRGGPWGAAPADAAVSRDPFEDDQVGSGTGVGGLGIHQPARPGTAPGSGRSGMYGLGGMRGQRAAPPRVQVGQPTAQGDLDKAIIRRYIRRNTLKIQYCYEKELLAKPSLSGTVQASFLIGPDGSVTRAEASGVDAALAACVKQVIAQIEFPKPKGGGNVQVSYPFVFRQADPSRPPVPGSDPDLAEDESGGTGTAMALEEGRMRKRDRAPGAGSGAAGSGAAGPTPAPGGPHVPGAANPLRGQEAALAACLRKASAPYGAFVFDLAPEATGTKLLVHGLGGEAGMCVVELAGKLPKQAAPVQRCSVAFGTMPVADAPAVEITAGEVQWLGKRVIGASAITEDSEAEVKIGALHARAEAYQKENREVATVAVRGPLVLRAPDDAPMKLVGRVIGTLARARMDYVPARKLPSGEWRLLRPIELPVVPVPADETGMWTISDVGVGEPPMTISLLVTPERIWLSLSKDNKHLEIPARDGRHDLAELERALGTHKRLAVFAERSDIEVSGADTVPYGDVAAVLEVAARAGFPEGRLLQAELLSARAPR